MFMVIGFPYGGNVTPNFSQRQVSRPKGQSTSLDVNYGRKVGCTYECNGRAPMQHLRPAYGMSPRSSPMVSPALRGRKGNITQVCDQGKMDTKLPCSAKPQAKLTDGWNGNIAQVFDQGKTDTKYPCFAKSRAKLTHTDAIDVCEPLDVVEIQGNVVEFHVKL